MFFKKYNYDSLVQSINDTQLARQEFRYKPSEVALLVIDVQSEFCDPDFIGGTGNGETYHVSKKIKSIVPAFRKASIPVYAIYFTKTKDEKINHYEFVPEKGDIIVRKDDVSSFDKTHQNLKKILKENSVKTIIACGFNKYGCVCKTLVDAKKKGFNAFLLEDLSGNDNGNKSTSIIRRLTQEAYGAMENAKVGLIPSTTKLLIDANIGIPKGIKFDV